MIFRSLASSSKGNAYIVTDGETTILLECGLPYKKLEKLSGHTLTSVSACCITHEHKDHSQAAGQMIRHGVPVYMSYKTAVALDLPDAEIITPGEPVRIGALLVMAFPVVHDAAEPIGYLIDDTRTRERLFFAADTRGLNYVVEHPTYIAVECNYEESLLESSFTEMLDICPSKSSAIPSTSRRISLADFDIMDRVLASSRSYCRRSRDS